MSYQTLLQALKGSASSGNFGHAGRPGKIGGSASLGIALGLVPGLPAGQYNVVYDASGKTHPSQRAILAAAKAGAGHVAVAVNGNYYVINTGDPNIQPFVGAYGDPSPKVTPWLTSHPVIQTLRGGASAAGTPTPAAPAKVYATKMEELYDKATPEAKDFANKYGMLAADDKALTYLKEMTQPDPNWNRPALLNREQAHAAANQQYQNKQLLELSADGKSYANKDDAKYAAIARGNSNYIVKRLKDPLGRGEDGYVAVPPRTKVKELPPPDPSKPDYNTMAALSSQPASKVAEHQAHADKNWNHFDNGQIKVRVKQAFDITMPQPLHDEYRNRELGYGNTKFLYHGTDLNGGAGIVRTGFFVGDTPKIGRINGNGIYLADQESKAAQYAHSGSGTKMSNSRSVMFITKAALGKTVRSNNLSDGSYGSGADLKPGVDTFIKTDEYKNDPYYGTRSPYNSTSRSTEYVVRHSGAIQPRVWLDIERTTR